MRRCWAATGAELEIDARTKVWLGKTAAAFGEAECAATQTVHFAASLALEWWCATNATAEQSVSSRHSSAIRFENDRITITALISLKIYTEGGNERNRRSRTVVTKGSWPACRRLTRGHHPASLARPDSRGRLSPRC